MGRGKAATVARVSRSVTPVVCFSGRIGSGKTSVSRAVALQLRAAWTGFGEFMREAAVERGLDPGCRDVLQALGERLIAEQGVNWLCHEVIRRANWTPGQPLVIDGVRHIAVLDELRSQLSGHPLVLIHLDLVRNTQRG